MINERHIFFDEAAHTYVDQYANVYTPVSNAYGRFKIPFKRAYWLKKKSIEEGTSKESIAARWDYINTTSVDKGNKKHNSLETAIKSTSKFAKAVNIININNVVRCFSVYDLKANSSIGEMSLDAFYDKIGHKYPLIFKTIKYYVDLGYKIYSEINVYDPINLISGTIDVLLVNFSDLDFVIIDWKTNKDDIKFEAGYYKKDKATKELTNNWVVSKKYMLYPLDDLEDCGGVHYSLQLSLYANMVELFGYTCSAILLFHIRDAFVLNKHGMPRRNERGINIVDSSKPENVECHIIDYYKTAVEKIRNHVGREATISTQKRLIM